MMLRIVTLRIASNGRLKGYMWCDCGAVQSVELIMVRSDCLVCDREQQTSKRGTEVFVFSQEIEINRRCLITNDRAGEWTRQLRFKLLGVAHEDPRPSSPVLAHSKGNIWGLDLGNLAT